MCERQLVVHCDHCAYNYGIAHDTEFNKNDIVCTYFETDGQTASDFCSHGKLALTSDELSDLKTGEITLIPNDEDASLLRELKNQTDCLGSILSRLEEFFLQYLTASFDPRSLDSRRAFYDLQRSIREKNHHTRNDTQS